MDPISAAGIGLSVTSLVLQVFAGCIKGYEIFVDATGVPESYRHLRTRLRIEQARLLNWGQSVGLVEELLEHPSQVLQLNRNLILDILLEMQAAFKSCVEIGEKYDSFVPELPPTGSSGGRSLGQQRVSFLKKTLALLDKQPRVVARLQWAMLKQASYEKLIVKMIGYNDRIESLLDRSSLDKLQIMQQQTHMVMLQLTEQVGELRSLSQAILIQAPKAQSQTGIRELSLSRSTTLINEDSDQLTFASLAAFKAQQLSQESSSLDFERLLIKTEDLKMSAAKDGTSPHSRPLARLHGKSVWIEYRESLDDHNSSLDSLISSRVQKLALLLSAASTTPEFRAPLCIGYLRDEDEDGIPRYGLVYQTPNQPLLNETPTPLLSLRDLFTRQRIPALNTRIALARTLASALMYLHSVNWLHKGLRSEAILFPHASKSSPSPSPDLTAPLLSGFDFSRPDLPDEVTLKNASDVALDLYRHPSLVNMTASRSQKSHDVYSLGVVLLEIVYWSPIEVVMGIEIGAKGARGRAMKIRERLLGLDGGHSNRKKNEVDLPMSGFREDVEARVGSGYADVVWRCIEGGEAVGVGKGRVETEPEVGVEMQRVLFEEVWGNLGELRV